MLKSLALACLFPLFTFAQQVVTIPAAAFERVDIPVYLRLKRPATKDYGLRNETTGHVYPIQWQGDSAVFIPADPIPANQEARFTLRSVTLKQGAVHIERSASEVRVLKGDHPVFVYHIAEVMPPADSPALYKRSGFIHPLYTPEGKIVTDAFPSNHAHQHALFHAWTHTRFKGHHVDFWNQHKLEGTVGNAAFVSKKEGSVFSELVTRQDYISLTDGAILREYWEIRIYNTHQHFLFDITVRQENITQDSLHLDPYIYGGMAFRGSAQWDPHNQKTFRQKWTVVTSEGKRDSAANHTEARWVTASGMVDGRPTATTVIGHPSNFRYPQKIRVHPDMPYWVFSPVIDQGFSIPPSGTYSARYRYLVTDLQPTADQVLPFTAGW